MLHQHVCGWVSGCLRLALLHCSPICLLSPPDGALCQGRSCAAQTCPACTHDAADRRPLLAAVTKDSAGFVFNEALLCMHSVTAAIWLSTPNMPAHFARKFGGVSKGRTISMVMGWVEVAFLCFWLSAWRCCVCCFLQFVFLAHALILLRKCLNLKTTWQTAQKTVHHGYV